MDCPRITGPVVPPADAGAGSILWRFVSEALEQFKSSNAEEATPFIHVRHCASRSERSLDFLLVVTANSSGQRSRSYAVIFELDLGNARSPEEVDGPVTHQQQTVATREP